MAYRDSKSGGYPFPSRPTPSSAQIIDSRTSRVLEQVRNEKLPPKVQALGKEAIVREKNLGPVKELNYTQKPKPLKAGNNSSF